MAHGITVATPAGIFHRSKNFSTAEEAATVANWIENGPARGQYVADVVQNPRTKRPAWFVQFMPTCPERQEQNRQREQAKRIESSLRDGDRYQLEMVSANTVFCKSVSGEEYLVVRSERTGQVTCNCKDSVACIANEIDCKHTLSVRRRMSAWK